MPTIWNGNVYCQLNDFEHVGAFVVVPVAHLTIVKRWILWSVVVVACFVVVVAFAVVVVATDYWPSWPPCLPIRTY